MGSAGKNGKRQAPHHQAGSRHRNQLVKPGIGATVAALMYVVIWAGLLGALADNLTTLQEAVTIVVALASGGLIWFSVRALMLEQNLIAELENLLALEDAQRFARALMDAIPAAIWLKTRDHRYVAGNTLWTEFNPRDNEFSGQKLEALLGHTDVELYGGERAAEFACSDDVVFSTGQRWEGDYDETRGGQHYVFHVIKMPVMDRWGAVTAVAGIGINITRRVEAEKNLAEEQALFDSFLLRSPDHVFITKTDRRITRVNAHMCEFLGGYPSELVGKDTADYVVQSDRERFTAFLERVVNAGSVSCDSIRFLNGAGQEMPLEISGVLLASREETPVIMVLGRHGNTDHAGQNATHPHHD